MELNGIVKGTERVIKEWRENEGIYFNFRNEWIAYAHKV